ncbi:hypothetical protein PISMIDRAFT_231838 [Pisolithus microcarpus 441]|uniref:Unplaced genomic scaffold scaffold_15, whole genome shotgun sequence n=1 Tax=Pisolithus microcarpus 441 TaxID=765257 RepID=A0A0D0A497_9AGAM|nr:hypothetical protein PISMIDRAFT_231838 [Pisolithus microcarpus 441]
MCYQGVCVVREELWAKSPIRESKNVCVMREYVLCQVCVIRESTVHRYEVCTQPCSDYSQNCVASDHAHMHNQPSLQQHPDEASHESRHDHPLLLCLQVQLWQAGLSLTSESHRPKA